MDWIPIGEPEVHPLTWEEKRVKELLEQWMSWQSVACRLRISWDRCREIIFEIRKKESIMGKGVPITEETREKIMKLHIQGLSAPVIAKQLGCGVNTIYRTTKRAAAQINPEFEAATNQMIEDMHKKSANAEQNAANAEKDTQPDPEKLPGVIKRAIEQHERDLQDDIANRENRIYELQCEIEEFRKDLEALKKWKEGHS